MIQHPGGAMTEHRAWPCTAAESAFLIGAPHARHALKLAALELVGRGVLRLERFEEPRRVFGTREVAMLVVSNGRTGEPVLDAVRGLVVASATHESPAGVAGHPLDGIARAARETWKREGGFGIAVCRPQLSKRGLLEDRERRFLGLPTRTWRRTPAGDALRQRFLNAISDAKATFRRPLDDAARIAFLTAAGPAVFLMAPYFKEIDALFSLRDSRGPVDGAASWEMSGTLSGFGGEFDALNDAFDSLSDALDGSDGGGDGGDGGDGGGD
jgi:hypothetical protein